VVSLGGGGGTNDIAGPERVKSDEGSGEECGKRKLAGTRRDRGCSFRSIPGFKRLGHGGP
jgi:hypothetical protein